ncbi:MAG: segregation and condensation protein A [Alphaproteobacteria bacterium]
MSKPTSNVPPTQLVVDLEAYDGPLEVLLELAKTQKVDLAAISILELVNQYLAFVLEVKKQNLELAADYLVMAAVLAYLKSKLLLPPVEVTSEEQDPAAIAAALAIRLKRLDAMKNAGEALLAMPTLGQNRFATARQPEASVTTNVRYSASIYDLLQAYSNFHKRREAASLTVVRPKLYKFEQALERLSNLLQVKTPTWKSLQDFLPESKGEEASQLRRSALASTLLAGLELSRQGKLELKQDEAFGPLMLRPLDQVPVTG